jgi:hypothetical protein
MEPPSALAVVSCESGDQTVRYAHMPDQTSLDAAYGLIGTDRGISGGDCADEVEGDGLYSVGGERAGSVLCYREDGGDSPISVVAWTDDRYRVFAVASRPDLADLTLLRWWRPKRDRIRGTPWFPRTSSWRRSSTARSGW